MTPLITDASTTNPMQHMIDAGSHLERKQASEAIPLLYGPWHFNAIKEVFRVCSVVHDWDSYGSPPPTNQAADRAIDIVTYVAASGLDESVSVPEVFPIPGGGLRLEWQSVDKELAVDIFPDGSVEFLQAKGEQVVNEGNLVRYRIPALLEWVATM